MAPGVKPLLLLLEPHVYGHGYVVVEERDVQVAYCSSREGRGQLIPDPDIEGSDLYDAPVFPVDAKGSISGYPGGDNLVWKLGLSDNVALALAQDHVEVIPTLNLIVGVDGHLTTWEGHDGLTVKVIGALRGWVGVRLWLACPPLTTGDARIHLVV